MKDVRIDLKFRNNLILRKMEAAGFDSVASLCGANPDLPVGRVYRLVALKESPLLCDGSGWTKAAASLAAVLECEPSELFSAQLMEARETNEARLEIDSAEVGFLIASLQRLALPPDTRLMKKELSEQIAAQLVTLTERERAVIERRFGLTGGGEETQAEIAASYGLSTARIQQIESKALRRLRHPSRSTALRPYIGLPPGDESGRPRVVARSRRRDDVGDEQVAVDARMFVVDLRCIPTSISTPEANRNRTSFFETAQWSDFMRLRCPEGDIATVGRRFTPTT